ncbi:transposase-like protein [Flavobacterium sp. 2755]|uniref:IS3 family transposase n=1 Tax=Flavobacterium sp. 2755 TaxID=2817765 RepID=UPI0028611857|nr:IS3 family transposase [Flavobacterium sp. 2755]MDR6763666.1 transposase-like protein [Flavobacterium sp. 2755]
MKKNRKKYDYAFKEKAVLLSYERSGTSLAKLEKELGLFTAALSSWRREYEKYSTADGTANDYLKINLERQGILELEKKAKKSELKFEILKDGSKYLNQDRQQLFKFIASIEKKYSVRMICEALDVRRASFHAWKNPKITEKIKRKIAIKKEITHLFYAFKQRYGCQRIAVELRNAGYQISCSTVYEYMKELGLKSQIKKK